MAISSRCLTTLPTKISAFNFNSYMRQKACYGDLKCIFEDLLPCYCYETKVNSRKIRSRVSQPASARKESNLVNGKLITARYRNSGPDLCSVSVISARNTTIAKINPTNRNWTADFTFSRNFSFLVPISRGTNARFAPPADTHDTKPDSLTTKIILCKEFVQIHEKKCFIWRGCLLERNRTESENLALYHFLQTLQGSSPKLWICFCPTMYSYMLLMVKCDFSMNIFICLYFSFCELCALYSCFFLR